MRTGWLLLLALTACRQPPPEPLPTMMRRPAPPAEQTTTPRCITEPIEAGWFQGQLWLCARSRSGSAWDCQDSALAGERVTVDTLLWGRAPGHTSVTPQTDADWDDTGTVTLRDHATGDTVQTASMRLGQRDVELSVVDGMPVMMRGWNVQGCDLLLHFGGR